MRLANDGAMAPYSFQADPQGTVRELVLGIRRRAIRWAVALSATAGVAFVLIGAYPGETGFGLVLLVVAAITAWYVIADKLWLIGGLDVKRWERPRVEHRLLRRLPQS